MLTILGIHHVHIETKSCYADYLSIHYVYMKP